MVTLSQANAARAQHADDLAKVGVHAVGVEKRDGFGQEEWVVVAYLDPAATPKLPAALRTTHGGETVDVPLVIERAEPFEPQ